MQQLLPEGDDGMKALGIVRGRGARWGNPIARPSPRPPLTTRRSASR